MHCAMTRLLFLPGAGGSGEFWRPAAGRLAGHGDRRLLSWPGLGEEPARVDVRGIDDLVGLTLAQMDEGSDLVAQSMGGLVAIKAALAAPDRVRRLVLCATSGGLPVEDLGASDWRADYRRDFPRAAAWITGAREDLSGRLGEIRAPTLLLWGDSDPISPVAVGERLAALLPDARLHVVAGGDHDLAVTHAAEVAGLIEDHLG
jgi:pimeloyl-ACP methyl ester carboxylesterase